MAFYEQELMKDVYANIDIFEEHDADPDGRSFSMYAEVGSEIYGIASTPFLGRAKRIIRYGLNVMTHPDERFSYDEDTQISIEGHDDVLHHADSNTVSKGSD